MHSFCAFVCSSFVWSHDCYLYTPALFLVLNRVESVSHNWRNWQLIWKRDKVEVNWVWWGGPQVTEFDTDQWISKFIRSSTTLRKTQSSWSTDGGWSSVLYSYPLNTRLSILHNEPVGVETCHRWWASVIKFIQYAVMVRREILSNIN